MQDRSATTLFPEMSEFEAGNAGSKTAAPLADRMRPRTLSEFVGQEHLVGDGRVLRRLIEGGPTLIMDAAWVLAKMVLGSALASLAAILIGLRRKTSVVSINNAIAESIVIGVSITLMAHALVAVLQFWGR